MQGINCECGLRQESGQGTMKQQVVLIDTSVAIGWLSLTFRIKHLLILTKGFCHFHPKHHETNNKSTTP